MFGWSSHHKVDSLACLREILAGLAFELKHYCGDIGWEKVEWVEYEVVLKVWEVCNTEKAHVDVLSRAVGKKHNENGHGALKDGAGDEDREKYDPG